MGDSCIYGLQHLLVASEDVAPDFWRNITELEEHLKLLSFCLDSLKLYLIIRESFEVKSALRIEYVELSVLQLTRGKIKEAIKRKCLILFWIMGFVMHLKNFCIHHFIL